MTAENKSETQTKQKPGIKERPTLKDEGWGTRKGKTQAGVPVPPKSGLLLLQLGPASVEIFYGAVKFVDAQGGGA